jgi:hypothetical protein
LIKQSPNDFEGEEMRYLPIVLVSLLLAFCRPIHAENGKPLKVIGSDLTIQTAEQGEFLSKPADPRRFKPSNFAGKTTGLFGWRMKVQTTRKSILVEEQDSLANGYTMSFKAVPKFGYIYSANDLLRTAAPGKYESRVLIDNEPVANFTVTVK